MRIYNSGFRCVSDSPPKARKQACVLTPSAKGLVRAAKIDYRAYLKESIQLIPTDCTTFKIRVPWFSESVWVVDAPEGHWGPFAGANDWPNGPKRLWQTDWQSNNGGTKIEYVRAKGNQSLQVRIETDGDVVRIRIFPRNIGRINLGRICVKTFSPFFSSQERVTQFRLGPQGLVGASQMPLNPRMHASLGWWVGEELPYGTVVTRSYDKSAYFAVIGRDGCSSWGNGWPHCTHLLGSKMVTDGASEITLLFLVGSERELLRRLRSLSTRSALSTRLQPL